MEASKVEMTAVKEGAAKATKAASDAEKAAGDKKTEVKEGMVKLKDVIQQEGDETCEPLSETRVFNSYEEWIELRYGAGNKSEHPPDELTPDVRQFSAVVKRVYELNMSPVVGYAISCCNFSKIADSQKWTGMVPDGQGGWQRATLKGPKNSWIYTPRSKLWPNTTQMGGILTHGPARVNILIILILLYKGGIVISRGGCSSSSSK